jgi:tetratricopeptide (TPR) repeat protein
MRRSAFVLVSLLLSNSVLADERQDCAKLMGDAAIAACTAAIRQNPRDALSYINRGVAHHGKKEYDQAIIDYTKALEINPKNSQAYFNRGAAHIFKFHPESSLPGDLIYIRAYSNRGRDAFILKQEYDRAIADCTRAIELDANSAPAYNNRAWAHFKAGKAAEGLRDVEKSLELSPNNARALDTRGNIFEVLGRPDEAIADIRRALSLGANDPEVQIAGKRALKRLGASP